MEGRIQSAEIFFIGKIGEMKIVLTKLRKWNYNLWR